MPSPKQKTKDTKSKEGNGKSAKHSQPAISPQQAAKLLRDKYLQQLDQRRPETDSAEAQATGQVEDAGSWAVDELTTHVPHSPRQRGRNIKDKSQTMHKPTGKAVPQPSSPAAEIKERPTVASEQQTAMPTIKERPTVQYRQQRASTIKERQAAAGEQQTAGPTIKERQVMATGQQTAAPTIKERPVEEYRQQVAPTIKERPTAASVQPAAGPTIKERQVMAAGQRTAAPTIKERGVIADTLPIRSAQEATGPVSGQTPGSTSELPTAAWYGPDTRPPSSASPVYEHTQTFRRSRAPQEISMLFAVLPETACQ